MKKSKWDREQEAKRQAVVLKEARIVQEFRDEFPGSPRRRKAICDAVKARWQVTNPA